MERNKIKSTIMTISLCAYLFFGVIPVIAQENNSLNFPYERGQSMVHFMKELAENKEYICLYTESEDITDIIAEIGKGNYEKPEAVYKVELSKLAMRNLLGEGRLDNFTDSMKVHLQDEIKNAAGMYLNAAQGSDVLAAAGICTLNKAFVDQNVSGSSIYLYIYKHSVPVLITFIEDENHAVRATSTFLFNINSDDLTTEQEVYEFFGGFFAQVEALPIKN